MRLNRRLAALRVIGGVLLAGTVPCAMAQPAASAAAHWGLAQLMHRLARVKSASARFTERKTMHLLNAPLVTSGTLHYEAPDQVRKTTLSPAPERFVLDGNRVTITAGADHRTRSFSLTEDPRIAGLIEGIRATLAGDLPALEQYYTVRLGGDAAHWRLVLYPKGAKLAHFVRRISISGSQDRIEAIDTASADGDHSEMRVAETVTDVR